MDWWTNPSVLAPKVAFFQPVSSILLNQIYQAPDAVSQYTLGDMIEPQVLGQTFYFETNGCSAVLYGLINEDPLHSLSYPVRTNDIAPYMVLSNNNAYAFDCGGAILGPFPLAIKLSLAAQQANFAFSWNSQTNLQYEIEVSTNLPYFNPLFQITPNSTESVFIDPLPIQATPSRFFRVRTLP